MPSYQHRQPDGRWRRTTLQDFGVPAIDVNDGTEYRCLGCGERWIPILRSGVCPACGSDDKEKAWTKSQSH